MKNPENTPSAPSTTKLPSAPKLLEEAIYSYGSNWKILVLIAAVPVIPGTINDLMGKNSLTILFGIIDFALSFIAPLALIYAVTKNGKVKESYAKSLKFLIPAGWITLLSSLATWGGALLLIIPGIIISVLVSLASFAFFSENLRGTRAIARSWYLVRGYKLAVFWRFLFFNLVFFLIGLISVVSTFLPLLAGGHFSLDHLDSITPSRGIFTFNFILGLFSALIVVPISTTYNYLIFNHLRALKPQKASDEDEKKTRGKILIFVWLGLLAIIMFFLAIVIPAFLLIVGQLGKLTNPTITYPPAHIYNVPSSSPSPSIIIPNLPGNQTPAI